jgi:Arc/MetJ-type ribon-helix-helix transcriptional regulator
MVMDTMQIRISRGLVERIDGLVETGMYSNRSDVIRDAVRRLVVNSMVGIAKGTSADMRTLRSKLSKNVSFKDIEKINKLID